MTTRDTTRDPMTPIHAGRGQTQATGSPLLEIRDLDVEFRTSAGPVRAVNGVTLDVRAGEIVGLVGESGSGKSVTSRAVMGLLPRRTTTIRGSIRLGGDELVGLPEKAYRRIRGERVAMIFQDPMTTLNPVMSIATHMIDIQYRDPLPRSAQRPAAGAVVLTMPSPSLRSHWA